MRLGRDRLQVARQFFALVQLAHPLLVAVHARKLLRVVDAGRLQLGAEPLQVAAAQDAVVRRVVHGGVEHLRPAEQRGVLVGVGREHDLRLAGVLRGGRQEPRERGVDLLQAHARARVSSSVPVLTRMK